jgi:hypothetical protein
VLVGSSVDPGEGPVGSDVTEHLVDYRQDVRVIDPVQLAAAVATSADDASRAELGQLLAGRRDARPSEFREGGHVLLLRAAAGRSRDQAAAAHHRPSMPTPR